MALPNRGYEDLPAQLIAAAGRIHAALITPDPRLSASQLGTAASDMDRLSAKVRAAADFVDLQSRRHLNGSLPAVSK